MRLREWAVVIAIATACALAVFLFGGAFRWVQALVALAVGISVAIQVRSRRRLARISPLLLVLFVAFLLTSFSLLPLPESLRAVLDPVGTSLRADGSALSGITAGSALTHDVPGSLRSLLVFLILIGVAMTSVRLAASERGRYRLMVIVASACALAAVVTGAHVLVGTHKLYGVYEPRATPTILGPLLNENHLGCLMALGACAAGGLVLYRRQRSALRAAWMGVVLLCGAMTAASHSRGAIISLLIGAVAFGGIVFSQRFAGSPDGGRRSRFATSSLPISIVGICVVVLVVYSSAGSVSAELDRTSIDEISRPHSKFAAWRSATHLIEESPWVGVGRGGFESTFTRIHPASGAVTFAYVENEYLQAIIDWGIVGACLWGAALLWFVAHAIRRWRDGPLAAGALAALAVVATQSNVDFGIELLGLAVPVTMLAASLSYVPLRDETGRALLVARMGRVVLATGLAIATLLLFSSATRSLTEDHEELLEHPSESAVAGDLRRHPLDYLGYATAASLTRDASSIRLLNHALMLHPTHPALHRRAARLLLASDHAEQAAIEYGLALRAVPSSDRLLREITTSLPPKLAAQAIPTEGQDLDKVLVVLRDQHQMAIATTWLQRILGMHPNDVHTCATLYEVALEQKSLDAVRIAEQSCHELPDRQTRVSLAQLMMEQKQYDDVLRILRDADRWQGLLEDKANARLLVCDAQTGLERWDEAMSCLHHLDASGDLPENRRDEITRRLTAIRDHEAAGKRP